MDAYTGGQDKEVVDGLMVTGDAGHLDRRGRLFVEGRIDEMIVSGGENVYPAEVEDALALHPAVAEAALMGVPDAEFGQRLRAFVVLRRMPRPRRRSSRPGSTIAWHVSRRRGTSSSSARRHAQRPGARSSNESWPGHEQPDAAHLETHRSIDGVVTPPANAIVRTNAFADAVGTVLRLEARAPELRAPDGLVPAPRGTCRRPWTSAGSRRSSQHWRAGCATCPSASKRPTAKGARCGAAGAPRSAAPRRPAVCPPSPQRHRLHALPASAVRRSA